MTMTNPTPTPTPPSEVAMGDQFDTSYRIDPGSEAPRRRWWFPGEPEPVPKRYLVQNRTPREVSIAHTDAERYGVFVVPPLGERIVAGARLKPFEEQLRPHRQRNQIRVRPYREARPDVIPSILIALAYVAVIGTLAYDVFRYGTLRRWEFLAGVLLAVVLFMVALVRGHVLEIQRRAELNNSDSDAHDVALDAGSAQQNGNETTRRAKHVLVLTLVVLIGAVGPAVAILAATDARNFFTFDGGMRVVPGTGPRLTSRVIQMIYVAILALFPALLFFQFDRHRVGTIWREWVKSIFRMDGRLHTLAELNAWYGDELSEASNNSTRSTRFVGGNHSPIVVATTLIALGWTVLVLQTESYDFSAISRVDQQVQVASNASSRASAAAETAADSASSTQERQAALAVTEEAATEAIAASVAAAEAAGESTASEGSGASGATGVGGPDDEMADGVVSSSDPPDAGVPATVPNDDSVSVEEIADQAAANASLASSAVDRTEAAKSEVLSTSYFQLLMPQPTAAAMAFLGAYFFAVYLVLRSYFRGDLRPKVYNQITARLVTVVVVAYLINVLWFDSSDPRSLLAMAFLAGVIPRTVVNEVLSFGNRKLGQLTRKASMTTERPLTEIDGVDLYDASLLESVGISDVPALANSNLTTVMVSTRMPVGQLIDWSDQAALMVVLADGANEAGGAVGATTQIARLREHGCRTATDFVETYRHGTDADKAALQRALDGGSADASIELTAAGVVVAVQRLRVWQHIYQWRNSELAQCDHWEALADADPVDAHMD